MNMNRTNRKIYLAFGVICLVFLLFIARVIQLQIFKRSEYTHYAESLSIKDIPDYPRRGIIYDRNMNQLTKNKRTFDFWITSTDINYGDLSPMEQDAVKETFKQIHQIVPIDLDTINQLLSEGFSSYRIARWVSPENAQKIDELNIRWLAKYEVYKRIYTFDYLASHVIGTVNDSNHGVAGLEYSMDERLAGILGKKIAKTDLLGNELALQDVKKYEAQNGYQIITTQDTVIEQYVATAIEKAAKKYKAKQVIAIVMETKTGKILAMESYPTYNLNDKTKLKGVITTGKSENEKINMWYQSWSNPAISWLYEPGSVSKLLTTAIGLEENKFNEEYMVRCIDGEQKVGETILTCWVYPNEHGEQTVREALVNSCNPAFIQLGWAIGGDTLLDYMYAFGLPYRTGVDLPGENYPLFPERSQMSLLATATMSYGHGYVVTPLQMLTAVNAIANDGKLVQPHIVSKIVDDNGNIVEEFTTKEIRQVISKETAVRMKDLMESVALSYDGTMDPSEFRGIRYGSKTGSSLLVDEETGAYGEDAIYSFFLTAPIEDPKYSILVILDEPKEKANSTHSAGGIAKEILLNIYDYEGASIAALTEDQQATVPDVTTYPLDTAIAALTGEGFTYTLVNYKGDTVTSTGTTEETEDTETQEEEETPVEEKPEEVIPQGDDVIYYVEEQFPKAGSTVAKGTNIILNLGVKKVEP